MIRLLRAVEQGVVYVTYTDRSDTARPNLKTKSSASNNPTSKRQRRATSSKASTITLKAHQAARVSVRQGSVLGLELAAGEKQQSQMRIESSPEVLQVT